MKVFELDRLVNIKSSFAKLHPRLTIPISPTPKPRAPYLFSSSALFFSSSFDAFSGMLSACTGPCLPVSVQPICCALSSREGVLRTGLALCAAATSSACCVSGGAVGWGWAGGWAGACVPCSGWSEAVESLDSFAILSVMPGCVSRMVMGSRDRWCGFSDNRVSSGWRRGVI